jgi:hypothetical protein
MTRHIRPLVTIRRPRLFDSNGRRTWLALAKEAGEPGEDAGSEGCAAPAPLEIPAAGDPDAALATKQLKMVSSWPFGS